MLCGVRKREPLEKSVRDLEIGGEPDVEVLP